MVRAGWKVRSQQQEADHVIATPAIKPCPKCKGNPHPSRGRLGWEDPPCDLCEGQGKIPDERCACGKPAIRVHPKTGISYCGKEACMTLRVKTEIRISSANDFLYDHVDNLFRQGAD